ncbi:MAG: SRPBCC family protein [Acidimicrobiales bacterium]
MANQIKVSAKARSSASRHGVFSLLSDSSTWARWSPFSSVSLVEAAPGGGEGPGAVKETRYLGMKGSERVVSLTPDRQMSYAYVKGVLSPYMRDYVAVVDLDDAEDGAGTEISWHSTFSARFPGSGVLPRAILERFLQRCADGLAEAAHELEQKDATRGG